MFLYFVSSISDSNWGLFIRLFICLYIILRGVRQGWTVKTPSDWGSLCSTVGVEVQIKHDDNDRSNKSIAFDFYAYILWSTLFWQPGSFKIQVTWHRWSTTCLLYYVAWNKQHHLLWKGRLSHVGYHHCSN